MLYSADEVMDAFRKLPPEPLLNRTEGARQQLFEAFANNLERFKIMLHEVRI